MESNPPSPSPLPNTRKRTRQELDEPFTARKGPKRERHPSASPSKVDQWLAEIDSPSPRECWGFGPSSTGEESISPSEMEGQRNKRPAALESPSDQHGLESLDLRTESKLTTNATSKSGTGDPDYINILRYNGITIDFNGGRLTESLWDFLNSTILKERDLSLDPKQLKGANKAATRCARQTESSLDSIMSTALFPLDVHDCVRRGAESNWHTGALPNNPKFTERLAIPKSDFFWGYDMGEESPFTSDQNYTLHHRAAAPCTKPAKTNTNPFLVLELKSEANCGSLAKAENQAATSGAVCVNGLRWLFKQARRTDLLDDPTQSLAFAITMTHRILNFYVIWYSRQENCFFMSWFDTYVTFKDRDVRECNRTMSNIFDWAIFTRKETIAKVLDALAHIPKAWDRKVLDYNADMSDDERSVKKQKSESPVSAPSETDAKEAADALGEEESIRSGKTRSSRVLSPSAKSDQAQSVASAKKPITKAVSPRSDSASLGPKSAASYSSVLKRPVAPPEEGVDTPSAFAPPKAGLVPGPTQPAKPKLDTSEIPSAATAIQARKGRPPDRFKLTPSKKQLQGSLKSPLTNTAESNLHTPPRSRTIKVIFGSSTCFGHEQTHETLMRV